MRKLMPAPTTATPRTADRAVNVVLLSTYDLGRQPFGLASPAAWLRRAGVDVAGDRSVARAAARGRGRGRAI